MNDIKTISDVLQRIREFLKIKGVSMLQVSDACGIKQNTFSRQIGGESALSASTLLSIIGCFADVNTEWLILGEGDILKSNEAEKVNSASKKYDAEIEIDNEGYLKIKIKQ
ncbi:helix-turn-helix domain-containing protein [Bacteroides clarus]|uniref:helix-turn-helix domain-containing protein n=1 Tax=Bacteroides clarus TaxID=626929 RepID=UPI001897DBDB|nr:helix-turn-helix transcriptional regulator [Bacteroides clarus]